MQRRQLKLITWKNFHVKWTRFLISVGKTSLKIQIGHLEVIRFSLYYTRINARRIMQKAECKFHVKRKIIHVLDAWYTADGFIVKICSKLAIWRVQSKCDEIFPLFARSVFPWKRAGLRTFFFFSLYRFSAELS